MSRAPSTHGRTAGAEVFEPPAVEELMKVLGIILILAGIVAMTLGSITYTKREKVLDVGPIEAHTEQTEKIPLPPVAGGLALVAGIILVARARS